MHLRDSTFTQGRVALDGNEFHRCHFRDTTLVFSASASVSLTDCSFENVTWALEGPAARVLAMMRALYHGAGDGGRHVIEQAFDHIRKASL